MKKLYFILIMIAEILLQTAFYTHAQNLKNTEIGATEENNLIANPTEKGTLTVVTVHSPGLVGNILGDSPDRKATVYLPPGYSTSLSVHYPVLYLFHGWGGDHDALFIASYNLKDTLDNLISSGKINPVILVSPSNNNKYHGSSYTNSSLAGNWEDFNAIDLVKYIDENFRTIPKSESRGIAGHSMGGYGAVKLGMKHPDIFSCIYNMSGMLDFNEHIKDAWVKDYLIWAIDHIDYAMHSMAIAFAPNKNALGYGEMPLNAKGEIIDSTWQKWLLHDPTKMVPIYKKNLEKLKAIVLECGIQELTLCKEYNSFSKLLKNNGIKHTLYFNIGGHDYTVSNRMGSHVFPFFSSNLSNFNISIKNLCHALSDSLQIKMYITDGKLYITPLTTPAEIDKILAGKVYSVNTKSFETVKIPAKEIGMGEYLAYGVTNEGFITSPVRIDITQTTPQMSVLIKDQNTGLPIPDCQVNINGNTFSTNKDGMITCAGCGDYSVQIIDPNMNGFLKNFNISGDTLFTLEALRKSYVSVVDKATRIPLEKVNLMYKYGNVGTNNKGTAIIQILANDLLFNFTLSQSDYFTLSENVNVIYGDTVTIALTRKEALLKFQVTDFSGPVANQKVYLGSAKATTDKNGIAEFLPKSSRINYTYTINKTCCLPEEKSFYLELDTLIKVSLLPDSIPAKIEVETVNDNLKITSNKSGRIYLVPQGTKMVMDSITRYQFIKDSITADVPLEIKSSEIPGTKYWLYMTDNCNNITKWVVTSTSELTTNDFVIYPNPVYDIVTVQTNGNKELTVELLTINGNIIYESKIEGTLHQINLTGLSKGVYLIRLNSNNIKSIRKIIKL